MAAKTIYVAGFLFRRNREEVALVKKNRPQWQAGKFNGIGGHVEPGETEYAAMVREFKEETGAEIKDWTPVAVLDCGDAVIHFFRSFSGDGVELQTLTDESIEWRSAGRIVYGLDLDDVGNLARIVPNLRWLIPMAADTDQPFGEIKSGFSS